MRGRRAAACGVLLVATTTGCQADGGTGRAPRIPLEETAAVEATTGVEDEGQPAFEGELEVRMVTGLRVSGLGCRQRTAYDACSLDGTQTYTWEGGRRPVTVTAVSMVPDAGFGTWVVLVRFAADDREAVQRAGERAGRDRRFSLVLDGYTGSALQAVTPIDVEDGGITVRDLGKQQAQRIVRTYVTAATVR